MRPRLKPTWRTSGTQSSPKIRAAAERVQRSIARAVELLKFFPHIGRPGSVTGTREKPVKSLPYVIVYTVEGGALVILRVYHGAQDRP